MREACHALALLTIGAQRVRTEGVFCVSVISRNPCAACFCTLFCQMDKRCAKPAKPGKKVSYDFWAAASASAFAAARFRLRSIFTPSRYSRKGRSGSEIAARHSV